MMHAVGAGFARPDDVLRNFSLGRQTLPLQWAETKTPCKQHYRLNSCTPALLNSRNQNYRLHSFGAPSHRALCSPRYGTEAHLVLLSASLATPKRSVTPVLLHSLKKYLLNSFKNTRSLSLTNSLLTFTPWWIKRNNLSLPHENQSI